MKNAVLKRFVFITLITLVVSTLVCLWLVGDYNLNQTKASMIDAVKLIDYSLDSVSYTHLTLPTILLV